MSDFTFSKREYNKHCLNEARQLASTQLNGMKRAISRTKRHGLSESEATELSERILGLSNADQARIRISSGRRSFARCADNRLTTAGGSMDISVEITSVFGKRTASVTTNLLSDAELTEAVQRSEGLARLAPENPEYLDEPGPQYYDAVDAYYDSTGEMEPDRLAGAMARAIRGAKEAGFVASAYVDVRAGSEALATSNGLFAYHASTGVALTLTVRAQNGSSSGWAGDESRDWNQIETGRIVADAVRKCREWQGKTALKAGLYDVVLEPTAVGMLMSRVMGAFDARSADEGRSYFSDPAGGSRIGEHLFSSSISLSSAPAHPYGERPPFDGAGAPRRPESWIENGVLKNLSYSRFWAQKSGVEPRPSAANIIMRGGNVSLSDMIQSIRYGVLITRFWYIRGLNPRTISYTGLTRDGTFLIENGEISRPVNNFRFNQSLAEVLQNVEMLGQPIQVAAGENSSVGTPVIVPSLKVSSFNLASVSDAI